jgi:hypothetical protein
VEIEKPTRLPSRPREFHPEPLTEPDLSLSTGPARATAERLPPSIDHRQPILKLFRRIQDGIELIIEASLAGAASSTLRSSRSLCRMPDQADAEDEHADGQQYCANVGEIDEPVRGRGIGRQHREEEGRRNQNRCNGGAPHKPFHGV